MPFEPTDTAIHETYHRKVKMKASLFVIARRMMIAFLLLSYQTCLYAQTVKERKVTSPNAAVYFEIGGPATSWFSVTGEVCFYRFFRGNLFHSSRVSIGSTLAPIDRYYLPISTKLLMFESNHHIEVGTGLSILLKQVKGDEGFSVQFPASPVVMTFALGYRYEPQKGGFQFRFAYSPFYEFTTGKLYPGVGISGGTSF